VAAWGGTDEDFSDSDSDTELKGLMAVDDESEDADNEVIDPTMETDITKLSHAKLIEFTTNLMSEFDDSFMSIKLDLKRKSKESALLKRQVSALKTENAELTSRNTELGTKVTELENIPSTSQVVEIEDLTRVETLQGRVLRRELQIKDLSDINRVLKRELTDKVGTIQKLKTELTDLEGKNTRLTTDLAKAKQITSFAAEGNSSGLRKAGNMLLRYTGQQQRNGLGFRQNSQKRDEMWNKNTKYPNAYDRRLCWQCGGVGHFRGTCPTLYNASNRNADYVNNQNRNSGYGYPHRTQYRPRRKKNTYTLAKKKGPKQVWVLKTNP
jgi:hypothetical protein